MKVGIYLPNIKGEARGGVMTRVKLLEKYIPYVEIFDDVSKAGDYDFLDLQFRDTFLWKYKHISTMHGVLPLRYCTNLHAQASMFVRTLWQKRAMKTAKAIITVSHEADRQAKKLCPNMKTNVVYAGLDPENYRIDERKEDKIIFLNSAEKYENLQVLLDAVKPYGDKSVDGCHYPFTVEAYSQGRQRQKYQNQVNKQYLPVNLKDEVDNKIIIKELSKARCLVQPCLLETFGFPIIEGMLSGCIVIASDILSHRENFENILFFNLKKPEELKRLIEEVMAGKYDYLIPLALKEVKEKYNVKRFIEETKAVYESVA